MLIKQAKMHQMCPILRFDILNIPWPARATLSQRLPSRNKCKDGGRDGVDDKDEEEDDDGNPEIGLDQIRCDVWSDYYRLWWHTQHSNNIQTSDKYLS